MAKEQSSDRLSHGSEARPNTPMADPFAAPDLLDNNTECTSTYKDLGRKTWIQKDNTYIWSNSCRIPKFNPQLSNQHTSTKQKTSANLPSLLGQSSRLMVEKVIENGFIKQGNESNRENMDKKSIDFKVLEDSLHNCKENDYESLTISKSAVTLPKIDTYCISYIRPATNHGFSYVVSSKDLLHAKSTSPKKVKREKAHSIRKELQKRTPENNFPHQGNVYLLFKAPSRACGLNIPGFTIHARPKELQHLKGAKQLKTKAFAKAAVKTNIVRLPDIKEDDWK